jgi:uncharacterized protein
MDENFKTTRNLNTNLVLYVESTLIPQFKNCDKGHDDQHAKNIIESGLEYAYQLKKIAKYKNLDINIAYASFAFLDSGLIPQGGESLKADFNEIRANHQHRSYKKVLKDKNLLKWFSSKEIKIIAEACKNHRSSNKNFVNSLYNNLAGDVDRLDGITIERTLYRSWYYNVAQKDSAGLSDKEIFNKMYHHLCDKYILRSGRYSGSLYRLKETKSFIRKKTLERDAFLKDKDKTFKFFQKLRNQKILRRRY